MASSSSSWQPRCTTCHRQFSVIIDKNTSGWTRQTAICHLCRTILNNYAKNIVSKGLDHCLATGTDPFIGNRQRWKETRPRYAASTEESDRRVKLRPMIMEITNLINDDGYYYPVSTCPNRWIFWSYARRLVPTLVARRPPLLTPPTDCLGAMFVCYQCRCFNAFETASFRRLNRPREPLKFGLVCPMCVWLRMIKSPYFRQPALMREHLDAEPDRQHQTPHYEALEQYLMDVAEYMYAEMRQHLDISPLVSSKSPVRGLLGHAVLSPSQARSRYEMFRAVVRAIVRGGLVCIAHGGQTAYDRVAVDLVVCYLVSATCHHSEILVDDLSDSRPFFDRFRDGVLKQSHFRDSTLVDYPGRKAGDWPGRFRCWTENILRSFWSADFPEARSAGFVATPLGDMSTPCAAITREEWLTRTIAAWERGTPGPLSTSVSRTRWARLSRRVVFVCWTDLKAPLRKTLALTTRASSGDDCLGSPVNQILRSYTWDHVSDSNEWGCRPLLPVLPHADIDRASTRIEIYYSIAGRQVEAWVDFMVVDHLGLYAMSQVPASGERRARYLADVQSLIDLHNHSMATTSDSSTIRDVGRLNRRARVRYESTTDIATYGDMGVTSALLRFQRKALMTSGLLSTKIDIPVDPDFAKFSEALIAEYSMEMMGMAPAVLGLIQPPTASLSPTDRAMLELLLRGGRPSRTPVLKGCPPVHIEDLD